MAIKTIDRLSIAATLLNEAGFCYFDPSTESLVEFSEEEEIYITPFEESVRRYYFVINKSFLINGKVPSIATIDITSQSTNIDIKVAKGFDRLTSKEDYLDAEVNNTEVLFLEQSSTGIIPIDIYFKSNSNSEVETSFNISIDIV